MVAETQSWDGRQLAVYLIAFVLAIGPFFNGMFFEPIRLVGAALACIAYWLWYTGKSQTNVDWNGVDISVLLWFTSYLFASITAVLPRGHLAVMLDMAAFLAVYTVVRFSPRMEQSFSHILVASGVVMAVISVVRFAGVSWLDRYVVDLVINNRLSGGFQYANTFAVWLFCLTLLTLREARRARLSNMFLMLGGLFAGTFMLTLSRGALIAAPAAYLVVVLLASTEARLLTAWTGLLTWGPALVLGNAAYQALQQQHTGLGLVALAACALPPLAAPYMAKFTEFLWTRKRSWGMAVGCLILLAAVWVAPRATRQVVPVLQEITDTRLTSKYSLADVSIGSRLYFDTDAWAIMSARHFLGAGGRGWSKLYLQVQSYPYFTTEVHNHFLQTGVEAGLIGMLAFSAMLAFAVITAWRFRKQSRGNSSLAVWAGVLTYIGIHSALDFDLSYISLLLLLAVAVGVISGYDLAESGPDRRWVPVWRHAVAGVTMLALIAAGSLYVSQWALLASDEAFDRGDVPATVSKLQLAARSDPFSSEPWLRMAALKSTGGIAGTALPDGKVLFAKAQSLDGNNPSIPLELAGIALQEKRWAEAIDLALKADSLMPLDQEANAAVASAIWSAVSGAAGNEERLTVRTLAAKMKSYEIALNKRVERAAPYSKYARAPVGHTAGTHLRIGQGLLVGGDYAAAASHLREAMKSQPHKAEAAQWLFVALDLGGNKQAAEKFRQDTPELFTQFLQSDLYRKVVAAAQAR